MSSVIIQKLHDQFQSCSRFPAASDAKPAFPSGPLSGSVTPGILVCLVQCTPPTLLSHTPSTETQTRNRGGLQSRANIGPKLYKDSVV